MAAFPFGQDIVATHDMLVEGVHFTPGCPPSDLAWKLVAVNLSDLAAMAARPVGLLTGVGFSPACDADWRRDFVAGLDRVLAEYGCPLWGGDTVAAPHGIILSATAIGQVAPGGAIARSTAHDGDDLWVSGTIGDSGLGLKVALGETGYPPAAAKALLARYRRPLPRLALGRALAGVASAMMDVSDGLAIDAGRLAAASGLHAELVLDQVPLSAAARLVAPDALLAHVTAGDDYELLFAAPPSAAGAVMAAATANGTPVTSVGRLVRGAGALSLWQAGKAVPLPQRLGHLHTHQR